MASFLAACVTVAGVAMAWSCADGRGTPPSHDEQLGKPELKVSSVSKELKRTSIVAHLHAPMEAGRTLVWCSTMQLAWNELCSFVTGGQGQPTLSANPGPLAPELMKGRGTRGEIGEGSFVATAGMGPATLDRIKKELAETFKGQASPSLLPANLGPDEILAYAYLFKSLEFPTPFMTSRWPSEWGGGAGGKPEATLDMWGWWKDREVPTEEEIRAQVKVLAYDTPERWSVELRTKSQGDRLVISRLAPGVTLAATVDAANELGKGTEPGGMKGGDTLRVPYLNFDLTESFEALKGVGISGSKAGGTISEAIQNIRFRLDEKGAVLKSEATIGVTSAPMFDEPKRMICDGPFLIQLMREGASTPYFAAWIANPEVLARTHAQ
ncbi:MAG: hypothetical protein WCK33_08050 [Phycisphaerae bacterium]